ncbi:unnamed protein product [Bursaphelenchus okinawaensis]|uniref:MFS domain-containing protein n=1 Tax=Bursaphelenchus okinawaensis TaxID=465554 RepID=A0A811KR93_9BILA|nr:unnamed protein product [Bursaphelenchus okinawaensis]CAG9108021.1 unnamed protein product [Bursaphelenchus okinawaensis]
MSDKQAEDGKQADEAAAKQQQDTKLSEDDGLLAGPISPSNASHQSCYDEEHDEHDDQFEEENVSYPGDDDSLEDHQLAVDDGFQSSMTLNELLSNYPDLRNGETIADHLPVPPDGGYGWVVVAASFFNNLVVDGIANSFGPFMGAYEKEFKASKALTSFIGSLLIGSCLLCGPVAGGLLNRYDARRVVICGAIIAALAFITSTASPNIFVHLLFYGFCGGVGFGLIYLPGIVVVSQYFESKRALATGIAVAGSGFGTFVCPLVCKFCIENYGWRVALYVCAGLIVMAAGMGSLFDPLPMPGDEPKPSIKERLLKLFKKADKKGEQRLASRHTSVTSHPEKPPTRPNSQCFSEIREDGQPLLNDDSHHRQSTEDDGVQSPSTPKRPALSPITENRVLNKSRAGSQHTTNPVNDRFSVAPAQIRTRKHTLTSMASDLNSDFRQSRPNLVNQLSRISVRSYAQSLSKLSQSQVILAGESMASIALSGVDPKEFNRPFSRKDIFLQGSIKNLPEFEAEGHDFKNYRESQISIPAAVVAQTASKSTSRVDIAEISSRLGGSRYSRMGGLENIENDAMFDFHDDSKFKWIPYAIRNSFNEMIDVNLLMEPVMMLMCVSNVIGMLGFYVPLVFIIDLAVTRSATIAEGTALLSVIGVTNTFGRVFFGWMADRRWLSALTISNLSLIFCGLLTMMCYFCGLYSLLMVYAALFGFIIAAYVSLTSIVLSDLLGVERLTNSFGLLVVSRGLASLMGTPLAGVVYDVTQSYDATFVAAGLMFILSGLIGVLVHIFHRRARSQLKNEGDYQLKDPDQQSGKLSVLTEHSEENLTEYQRTIQSLKAQHELIKELENIRAKEKVSVVNEEEDHEAAADGEKAS